MNWQSEKDRERVIMNMCYTMRHDYGLDKIPGSLVSGMTPEERTFLRLQMTSIFENCIVPYINDLMREQTNGEQEYMAT